MKATFKNQFIVACVIVIAIAIGGVATNSDALIVISVIGVIATMLGAFIHIEVSTPVIEFHEWDQHKEEWIAENKKTLNEDLLPVEALLDMHRKS